MKLIRWNPTHASHDFQPFRLEVDRLFDSLLTQAPAPRALTLAVDIEESPEAFVFHADLPGVKPSDVKVTLEGDTLTIQGERKHETSAASNPHRVERAHGAFTRSFTLNTPVRGDQVQATYRDGVLEVRVPKAEEAKVRDIEVKVG